MEEASDSIRFGDYIPKECLGETTSTRSWLAEQESVGRMVLIEELKQESMGERDAFLADVRAKAAVEHPLVGSIYEASTDGGRCYFAHELLPGKTMTAMAEAGKKLKAGRFVHILRRIAETNIYHETHDNATSPLGLDHIHMDPQGVVRMDNLAIAGERPPDHSVRDVVNLGTSFQDLLDQHFPGTTRCLTLLAWMRGEEVPKPLRWQQIRDYCEQIEQQLSEPAIVTGPPTAAIRPEKKNGFVWVIAILLVAVGIGILLLPKKKRSPSANAEKPGWVTVEAGRHVTPSGLRIRVSAFEISAYEVTIGEYAEFLETLGLLSEGGSDRIFDHSEQPPEKTDHVPDDWNELFSTARQAGIWNERPIDIHTPVVGVDWWDAYAYAKWKKSTLPTQEQWLGALMAGAKVPSAIPVSDLIPVTEKSPDRTTNGILGMAGSVSEWTGEPRANPSNPLGKPLWVIIGGSYLNPAQGATTREWTADRSIRRPDLGFRICKKPQ